MKHIKYTYLSFWVFATALIVAPHSIMAQCAYNNAFYLDLTPTGVGNTQTSSCTYAGDYNTVSVVLGATYYFHTCGSGYDTELTLFNAAGSLVLASNDDGPLCSPESEITWVATYTGVVHVLLDEYPCLHNSTCSDMSVTWVSGGGGGAPANDEPCTATALAVGATCSFSTYTNASATNSSLTVGVTLPTCANYNGGDVWFTAIVPASGHLIIDSDDGVILDSGIEIYRGTCGALTGIDCDDDGSLNASMSLIDQNTLVPGETIWIRVWEYGGDNNGTFGICVYDGGGSGGGPCAGGAGGDDCPIMQPVCTGITYCYTAGIGSTASAGNDYGCLFTQPNPSWYYFEISTAGNLVFDLAATSDIDFAVWGPYANAAAANAACGSLPLPVDCSYSISPTEQVNLPGVSIGQVYVLVITNYAAVVQDISMAASGGNTAATNCAIVNPTPCAADAGNW